MPGIGFAAPRSTCTAIRSRFSSSRVSIRINSCAPCARGRPAHCARSGIFLTATPITPKTTSNGYAGQPKLNSARVWLHDLARLNRASSAAMASSRDRQRGELR